MSIVPKGYKSRLLDETLDRRLKSFGAVEVAGAKYCGKTWLGLAHASSVAHIDDDAVRQMVELDVSLAMEGKAPHLVDEWQDVPKIWDAIRRRIDETGNKRGQFILTGSSTVDKTKVSHSGAGRIAKLQLRPMSLFESGNSDGSISLAGMFAGEFSSKAVKTDARSLANLICKGGWPATAFMQDNSDFDLPVQYLNTLFEVSARKGGLDCELARKISVSLARNVGRAVTYKTLYKDVFSVEDAAGSGLAFYQHKLEPYINFLTDQYILENLYGWDAPIKSKSRVRSKPKRCFVDPSLPASLLSMTPDRMLLEMQVFETLFEELCIRDVRIYASAMGLFPEPKVYYYSDAEGLEADIIVELADGRWGAFEVKLNGEKVFQAESSLLRLKNKIARNFAAKNPEPSFLAVLVGKTEFAMRLPSGVYVVPITCLGA